MSDDNEGENEEEVTKVDLLYNMKLSYFSYSWGFVTGRWLQITKVMMRVFDLSLNNVS